MSQHELILNQFRRFTLLTNQGEHAKLLTAGTGTRQSVKTTAMLPGYDYYRYGGYATDLRQLAPPSSQGGKSENFCPGCCNRFQGHDCWWQPPANCYSMEFCRLSSLHGLRLIGDTYAHFVQRLLFVILFILAIVASFYYGSNIWEKFIESPTIVTFTERSIPIDNIPFPAITICNVNNVRKSEAERLVKILKDAAEQGVSGPEVENARTKLGFLQTVCESTTRSLTSEFSFSVSGRAIAQRIHDILEEYGGPILPAALGGRKQLTAANLLDAVESDQPCDSMIPYCTWQGQPFANCSELFTPVVTDFGKCCSFNVAPLALLYKNGYNTIVDEEDRERTDAWNSTETQLNIEALVTEGTVDGRNGTEGVAYFPDLPRRVRSAGQSNGLSVFLDPDIDDYLCTTSDSMGFHFFAHLPIDFPHVAEYGEAIGPGVEAFFKVSPEVTKADDAIEQLSSDERKCYFTGEYELDHFAYYTQSNCVDECLTKLNIEVCKCTAFFMPRNETTPLCHDNGTECSFHVGDLLESIGKDVVADYCDYCLPTCTDVTYRADVSSRPINFERNDWSRSELNITQTKESRISIVHVYFDQDSTIPKIRKPLYVLNDMIANIGGLLGLTMGFSVLSMVELVYFLVVKMCGKNLYQCNGGRCMKRMRRCCGQSKKKRALPATTTRVTFVEPYNNRAYYGQHDAGEPAVAPLSVPHTHAHSYYHSRR